MPPSLHRPRTAPPPLSCGLPVLPHFPPHPPAVPSIRWHFRCNLLSDHCHSPLFQLSLRTFPLPLYTLARLGLVRLPCSSPRHILSAPLPIPSSIPHPPTLYAPPAAINHRPVPFSIPLIQLSPAPQPAWLHFRTLPLTPLPSAAGTLPYLLGARPPPRVHVPPPRLCLNLPPNPRTTSHWLSGLSSDSSDVPSSRLRPLKRKNYFLPLLSSPSRHLVHPLLPGNISLASAPLSTQVGPGVWARDFTTGGAAAARG